MNINTEVWEYAYDPFGRRLSKERKDKLAWVSTEPKRTHFVWDGSRLLQEYNYKGSYTYFYTDQDSYEPLAQVFYNNKDEQQYLAYFHTDQIGIPREMTDPFGNLLWYGEYTAWGSLKKDERVYQNVHQSFRLQNQYFDNETGLHYNFFRYYESETGRFINQDPIGLVGGDNFYNFAVNSQSWIDPLGLLSANELAAAQARGASAEMIAQEKFGFTKNTQVRVLSTKTGRFHIPDGVKGTDYIEVKNVKKQGLTRQINSFIKRNPNGKLILIVDKKTKLTQGIKKQIASGKIKVKRINFKKIIAVKKHKNPGKDC